MSKTAATRKRTHREDENFFRSCENGHSSQANDNVVTIVDEDPVITQTMTASSQNLNEPAVSDGALKEFLFEFEDVKIKIYKCQKQLESQKKTKRHT